MFIIKFNAGLNIWTRQYENELQSKFITLDLD